MKLTCQPEGDGTYLPTELYTGTFDRIAQTIFAPSCAIGGCHDSDSSAGELILLPNAAYSQIVGVAPTNPQASNDGLQRIFPGDPDLSLLYLKIDHTAEAAGYGPNMPLLDPQLPSEMIELVRLWIIGDVPLGPAPENGWVEGTDQ
jgi:hypothetical protein